MRQSLRLITLIGALLAPTLFSASNGFAKETAVAEQLSHNACDEEMMLNTEDASICFSRYQGAFRWVRLINGQYFQTETLEEDRESIKPSERYEPGPLDLVTTWDAPFFPFQIRDWRLSPDPEVTRILRQDVTATFKSATEVETKWYVKFSKSEGNLEKWVSIGKGVEILYTPGEGLSLLDTPPAPNTGVNEPVIDPTTGLAVPTQPASPAKPNIAGKERVLARVIKRQRAGSPWYLVELVNPGVATPKQSKELKVRLQITGDFSKVISMDPRFKLISGTEKGHIRMVWPNPDTDRSDLFIERHYRVGKTRFTLDHILRFFWTGEGALKHREVLKLFGRAGLKQEEASMLNPFPEIIEPICSADESVESWDGEEPGEIDKYANAEWVGLGRRYFLLGVASTTMRGNPDCVMSIKSSSLFEANLVPTVEKILNDGASMCTPDYRTKEGESSCQDLMKALGIHDFSSRRQAELKAQSGAEGSLSNDEKIQVINLVNQDERAVLFAGPKDLKSLQAAGNNYETALDFGIFSPISTPLLWLLQFYHGVFGHWAWGIFFLTITVKLILLYWTMKSYVSMRNMQRLKPEMEKLKEKHKDNKQELNQAMMGLYKRHGVNPLGGCLPMLIQMPVYFALYRTIYATPDLYQAPLFMWIQDLSKPDPLFVMPIALGVLMFIQQRISMGLSDGAGPNKMLLYFMPFMFTGLMLFLPSGLVFYILINTALSLVQQRYIYKKNPVAPAK